MRAISCSLILLASLQASSFYNSDDQDNLLAKLEKDSRAAHDQFHNDCDARSKVFKDKNDKNSKKMKKNSSDWFASVDAKRASNRAKKVLSKETMALLWLVVLYSFLSLYFF